MALTSLVLPAPAKLNLFLHIIGRRTDGYHQLQTVFQFLDYSDEIHLELRPDQEIQRIEGGEDIPVETDLCMRAAQLLQHETGTTLGVNISLKKKLPIGGGLGGGSSNAATVLLGLNQLWQCGLNRSELATLGLKLGADVPVFIHGQTAWAEGIGEKLTTLALPENWFLVIHPKISVSTAEIFADQGLTRDCDALKITRFLKDTGFEDLSNVFEPIVRNKYPDIANALDWLSNFSAARLTGTGSCLFASFNSEAEAKSVLQQLSVDTEWDGFVAKGVNVSPLMLSLQ